MISMTKGRQVMYMAKKVYSRERILNALWSVSEDPLTNVVDVYIARLRRKIDTKGREALIETVRGHGYRLKAAN